MAKTIRVLAVLALAAGLAACAGKEAQPAQSAPIQNTQESTAMATNPKVLLKTTKGDITIELDAQNAPDSAANFIKYVQAGQYDGLIFHRVIPNFMIQGGGMDANMQERPTRAPIMNEAENGLKNNKYTLAMARTSDPHSATAQFFINTNDNDFLNHRAPTAQGWGYAVFGKVTAGQDVVDAIEAAPTTRKYPHDDVPVEPITIQKAEVLP